MIEMHIKPAIGTLKAEAVTRGDVIRIHRSMANTPRRANHVLAVLSKMFNLAELWGIRNEMSNPCRLVKRYPENARERFLSVKELGRLGAVLDKADREASRLPGALNAIRLLALTGCRLGEILSLQWENVDIESGNLMLQDAKAGARAHSIGSQAIALLDSMRRTANSQWVIEGNVPDMPVSTGTLENTWRALRVEAELKDVRLHDLRHTVGTYASQTGANAFLIRDKLGHKTLAMTGRYVSRDAGPLRVLSDQIEDRVAAAMRGKSAEILNINQAGKLN